MLPNERVQCRPGNPVILLWGEAKYSEIRLSSGGTTLLRDLHFLDKIESGLCYFGPTNKNTTRKEGLVIVVRSMDIIEPQEFKRRAFNLYQDGWLRANDRIIHRYYPTDDIQIVDINVVPWTPPVI